MSWSKNCIRRTVSIAVCMLWVALVLNAHIVRELFCNKHVPLCLLIAPKLRVPLGGPSVVGQLGLDNNCLLCLLEQCILGCLQTRSDARNYLDGLYSELIAEENCFINGRQVWFYWRVLLFVEERMWVVCVCTCVHVCLGDDCFVWTWCTIEFLYKLVVRTNLYVLKPYMSICYEYVYVYLYVYVHNVYCLIRWRGSYIGAGGRGRMFHVYIDVLSWQVQATNWR